MKPNCWKFFGQFLLLCAALLISNSLFAADPVPVDIEYTATPINDPLGLSKKDKVWTWISIEPRAPGHQGQLPYHFKIVSRRGKYGYEYPTKPDKKTKSFFLAPETLDTATLRLLSAICFNNENASRGWGLQLREGTLAVEARQWTLKMDPNRKELQGIEATFFSDTYGFFEPLPVEGFNLVNGMRTTGDPSLGLNRNSNRDRRTLIDADDPDATSPYGLLFHEEISSLLKRIHHNPDEKQQEEIGEKLKEALGGEEGVQEILGIHHSPNLLEIIQASMRALKAEGVVPHDEEIDLQAERWLHESSYNPEAEGGGLAMEDAPASPRSGHSPTNRISPVTPDRKDEVVKSRPKTIDDVIVIKPSGKEATHGKIYPQEVNQAGQVKFVGEDGYTTYLDWRPIQEEWWALKNRKSLGPISKATNMGAYRHLENFYLSHLVIDQTHPNDSDSPRHLFMGSGLNPVETTLLPPSETFPSRYAIHSAEGAQAQREGIYRNAFPSTMVRLVPRLDKDYHPSAYNDGSKEKVSIPLDGPPRSVKDVLEVIALTETGNELLSRVFSPNAIPKIRIVPRYTGPIHKVELATEALGTVLLTVDMRQDTDVLVPELVEYLASMSTRPGGVATLAGIHEANKGTPFDQQLMASLGNYLRVRAQTDIVWNFVKELKNRLPEAVERYESDLKGDGPTDESVMHLMESNFHVLPTLLAQHNRKACDLALSLIQKKKIQTRQLP